MSKKISAEEVPGLEKSEKTHPFRMLLFGIALYFGFSYFLGADQKPQQESEPQTAYSSLEAALLMPLPHYEYNTLVIKDEAGPLDPVKKDSLFLGYVYEEAQMIRKESEEIGYLVKGVVHNETGRKIGKIILGKEGLEIYSFENKKWASLANNQIISSEGVLLGTVGPKTAVIIDRNYVINGVITSYDYSRNVN